LGHAWQLGESISDRLQQEGNVIEMPALEIISNWQALDNALAHLSDFNFVLPLTAWTTLSDWKHRVKMPVP